MGGKIIYLDYECAGKANRVMTPAHEVIHALGRAHEHQRPDRDTYVTIKPKNTCQFHNYYYIYSYNGISLLCTGATQMEKVTNLRTHNIAYDYESVMHYSRWQCSYKSYGFTKASMTFTNKYQGRRKDDVGQRARLSDKDIQHINAEYCPGIIMLRVIQIIMYLFLKGMMMRLVGGQDNSEGRLEVKNEEVWGTVCSDGFDRNDANVVCKYLGRPGVEEVYSAADILNIESAQDSPIWLSDLECTGKEDNPFHCSQKVMKHHTNCDHNQDVAIKCSSKHMSHIVTSYCLSLFLQRLLVWLVVMITVDAWKFIIKGNGALCVATCFIIRRLM